MKSSPWPRTNNNIFLCCLGSRKMDKADTRPLPACDQCGQIRIHGCGDLAGRKAALVFSHKHVDRDQYRRLCRHDSFRSFSRSSADLANDTMGRKSRFPLRWAGSIGAWSLIRSFILASSIWHLTCYFSGGWAGWPKDFLACHSYKHLSTGGSCRRPVECGLAPLSGSRRRFRSIFRHRRRTDFSGLLWQVDPVTKPSLLPPHDRVHSLQPDLCLLSRRGQYGASGRIGRRPLIWPHYRAVNSQRFPSPAVLNRTVFQARQAIENHSYDSAIQYLQSYLGVRPRDADGHAFLGCSFARPKSIMMRRSRSTNLL